MKELLIIIVVLLGFAFVRLVFEMVKESDKKSDFSKKKAIWLLIGTATVLLLLSPIQYYLYFYILTPPPDWSNDWISKHIAPIACLLLSITCFALSFRIKFKKVKS